jgi:hypothetical protein
MFFPAGFPDYFAACESNPANTAFFSKQMRNQLLSQSDWTQLVDVSLTEEQKAAWAEYRQALRDVTKQPGFPESITWPSTPQ